MAKAKPAQVPAEESADVLAERGRLDADVAAVMAVYDPDQPIVSPRDRRDVARFLAKLGLRAVLDSMDAAAAKREVGQARWKYFCGTCWGKIRALEEANP